MSWLLHQQNYNQLIAEIKIAVTPIPEGLDLLLIFGSISRISGTVLSDVDILASGSLSVKKKIKEALSNFSMNHGIGVDLIYIPEEHFSIWKNHPLIKRSLKEGIILWGRHQLTEKQ